MGLKLPLTGGFFNPKVTFLPHLARIPDQNL